MLKRSVSQKVDGVTLHADPVACLKCTRRGIERK